MADGSVTTGPNLSGYVPYTGATTNVDLGSRTLTTSLLFVNPVASLASGAVIRTYNYGDPNWGFSNTQAAGVDSNQYHIRVHGSGGTYGNLRQFQVIDASQSNNVRFAVNFDGSGAIFSSGLGLGGNAPTADRQFYISGSSFTSGTNQYQAVFNTTFVNAASQVFGLYLNNNTNANVTASYALYMPATGGSGTIGTKWAIYQAGGSDNNYFAGKVLVNTNTDAGYLLDVNGLARVKTLFPSYAASTLANQNSGIIWTNGTIGNAFGFVVQSGLFFQGDANASNNVFGVKAPTSDGSLGSTVFSVSATGSASFSSGITTGGGITINGALTVNGGSTGSFATVIQSASTFAFGSTNGRRIAVINTTSGDQPGLQFGYDATDNTGIIAGSTQASGAGLDFYTYNGSSWGSRIRVTKDGELGIGVIPSSGNRFWVKGSDSTGSNSTLVLQNSNGTIVHLVRNDGSAYFQGGNIGIGTVSAAYSLDVVSSGGIVGRFTGNSGAYLILKSNGVRDWWIANGVTSGTDGWFGLYNATAGFNALSITSGNNVLVGTTTDNGYRFQVNGTATATNIFLTGSNYDYPNAVVMAGDTNWTYGIAHPGSEYWMQVKYYGTGDDSRGFRVLNVNGNTIDFRVNGGGSGFFRNSVTATAFYESSDIRLKTLIESNPIIDGIEKLEAKLYEKNGKIELGYFAQDTELIMPHAVQKGTDGFLNLSYREVHTAKIARLEQRVEELEKQLNVA